MSFYAIIPARAASTRLPGKMLAEVQGLPLVIHTARRAQQSQAKAVIIATDDVQIASVAKQYGFDCMMTCVDHPSGTDRLAEVAQVRNLSDDEIVVNVQGDEPLIEPALINQVAHNLMSQQNAAIATAAYPITETAKLLNPNIVKVISDTQGYALTFSRAPIPWDRNHFKENWQHKPLPKDFPALHHIGIYAYRVAFLKQYPQLKQGVLEQIEQLEQLRAIEHGFKISLSLTQQAPLAGVDTPEDLERLRQYLSNQP